MVLTRLDDMKAEDTLTIDLRDKTSIGDYMVVSSGRSAAPCRIGGRQGRRRSAQSRRERPCRRHPALRLGSYRCWRRHRACLSSRGSGFLQSRKDVDVRRRRTPRELVRTRRFPAQTGIRTARAGHCSELVRSRWCRVEQTTPVRRPEHDPEKWNPVFGSDHAQTQDLDHDPIQLSWLVVEGDWSIIA